MHIHSITLPLSSSFPPFIFFIDLPSICVRGKKKKGEEWSGERRGLERGGPQPSATPPAVGVLRDASTKMWIKKQLMTAV